MSFIDGVLNEMKQENKLTKWYVCEGCQNSYTAELTPNTCPVCGCNSRQWVGNTEEEAISRAKRSFNLSHKKEEPKDDTERKELEETLDKLGIKHSKRMKNATLRKLLEEAQAEEEPEVEEEEPEVEEDAQQVDYKALRKEATKRFIKKHKLNELSPVGVGTAEVQLVGFTLWKDKKPAFRFMQPFETIESFQKVYDLARAEQPSCDIDVVRCNNVSDEELKACLYNGDAIVSLHNGNGTAVARPGDIVELGALKTSTGNIRFVALQVIRR